MDSNPLEKPDIRRAGSESTSYTTLCDGRALVGSFDYNDGYSTSFTTPWPTANPEGVFYACDTTRLQKIANNESTCIRLHTRWSQFAASLRLVTSNYSSTRSAASILI